MQTDSAVATVVGFTGGGSTNGGFLYVALKPLAEALPGMAGVAAAADNAIVDGPSTLVTDCTLLKVYAWYDNEIGYVCRMVDLANMVIEAEA